MLRSGRFALREHALLRVPIVDARPGMVLGLDIPHPSLAGGVLLRRNAELDDRCIARLGEMGVREIYIRYPGLEHLAKFHDPRVMSTHRKLVTELAGVLDAGMVQKHVELDYWSYRRAVADVLDALMANPAAAALTSDLASGDAPHVRHHGGVCMLSLLMALKLDYYLIRERPRMPAAAAKNLAALGVGAMLHDIGMTRIAPDALRRWNLSPDESDPGWQEHVQLGHDLVSGQIDPAAAGVVLHHHQHWDGTGFPPRQELSGETRRFRGSEIHVFARIVAAAETLQRLRYPAHAPGADDRLRPPRPTVAAMHDLLRTPLASRIDPLVLRALVTVVPPFAPGTIVTITGGRSAAVVEWSPLDPCRPVVEVLPAGLTPPRRGREPEHVRIDLRVAEDVQVREAEGHDVTAWLFSPTSPGEFDLSRATRAMDNRALGDLSERPAA